MPCRQEPERPRYVLENHEDDLYHNQEAGGRGDEPEYCALLGKVWTFNRAMRWARTEGGNIICHCGGADLTLTGEGQVSAWHSAPANVIESDGEFTRFVKKSTASRRDCAVVPSFQFQLDEHPTIEVTVEEATDDWQFVALVKGRAGPPIASSEWQRGAGTAKLDVAVELARRGYSLHYAELHLAIGVWSASAEAESSVRFRVRMPARPALVPCLPVVRTEESARSGVPIAAVVTGARGEVQVRAEFANGAVDLAETDGVWTGRLDGLGVGDYLVRLMCEGAVKAQSLLRVRVTDGRFYSYDHAARSLVRGQKPVGPITGSYSGMVYARDAGLPTERLIQGQQQWDAWDRVVPPGARYHFWEALTEAELEERFAYLESCGWHVLHLCQHWGIWERLDAGGRIAPHGAEQVALVLRTACRHGLALLQALSHYPYGEANTRPFAQYWEAGFKDEDWQDPDSAFTGMFHRYLEDYVTLFRDETALLAMSTSGEGDIKAGPARVNRTREFVTSLDPNHVFISEPILRLEKLPAEHYEGWQGELHGSRMYWIGDDLDPEFDQAVEFKLLQLGPCFMAEGSWPYPPPHSDFMGIADPWIGTARYRARTRDAFYIGMVHRTPVMITWDEQTTEDEHKMLEEARQLVDWSQPFMAAPVALRVDSSNVRGEGRETLVAYERFFAARPIACRYVTEDGPADAALVIDARTPYGEPELPGELNALMPLGVSPGYSAQYLWSDDRRTLLAYVCNSMGHLRTDITHALCGHVFRAPMPAPLTIELRNLPSGGLQCRVYDLCEKTVFEHMQVDGQAAVPCGVTDKDFLVIITPLESG